MRIYYIPSEGKPSTRCIAFYVYARYFNLKITSFEEPSYSNTTIGFYVDLTSEDDAACPRPGNPIYPPKDCDYVEI